MTNTIKARFQVRIEKGRTYRHWVLVKLYKSQTTDERADKKTTWLNRKGFSTMDAAFLTSLAEKLLNGEKLSRRKERELVRRLPKYWRQFVQPKLVEMPARPARKPKDTTNGGGRRVA